MGHHVHTWWLATSYHRLVLSYTGDDVGILNHKNVTVQGVYWGQLAGAQAVPLFNDNEYMLHLYLMCHLFKYNIQIIHDLTNLFSQCST